MRHRQAQTNYRATYKLTIEYEGTRYSGWQAQSNTQKTVQGALLRVGRELYGEIELGGSGRTDAGVHAAGQVAHLRVTRKIPHGEIVRSFNDRLPHDIHLLDAEPADPRFHARHDAVGRTYLYQISRRRSAFAKPFVWWIKDRLDIDAMGAVAPLLCGMHDFAAFADRRIAAESTMVLVEKLELAEAGDLILIRISASHFLWKMVRKIAAILVETGRGNSGPERVSEYLSNGETKFEVTAPPSGLFLQAVSYPGESFDEPLEPIVPVPHVSSSSRGIARARR